MPKNSVNLIIQKEKETLLVKKLKIVLPLLSIILLVSFGIVFLITFFYINSNIRQFNLLQIETERYEKKISDQKTNEGIYSLTGTKLNVLNQLLADNKNFSPALYSILELQTAGISITQLNSDKQGNLSLVIIASSSGAMDRFISNMLAKEDEKLFSTIQAQGIVRERKGSYLLSISMKGNSELFK